MIIIATIIVSPAIELALKERIARAEEYVPIPAGLAARIITEWRLPHDVVLTSGKALVHGSEEYERLLAEALAKEPQS